MRSDSNTTLEDLKEQMRRWVSARQWEKYHLPKNLAASVTIEAGELLELFQWLTPEEVAQRSKDEKFRTAVGEEMCDVLMYLVSLANAMDIDLADAIAKKMQKNVL
jgi:dCTP diphosphatase